MPGEKSTDLKAKQLAEKALSRWENEGGAAMPGAPHLEVSIPEASDARPLGDAELSQLHIRVVALEGLVTALLADACERRAPDPPWALDRSWGRADRGVCHEPADPFHSGWPGSARHCCTSRDRRGRQQCPHGETATTP